MSDQRTEEELERVHRLLEAIMDQSPVPMVVATAPDLIVRYGNRAALECLGILDEPSHIGLSMPEIARRQTWRDYHRDGSSIEADHLPIVRALHGESVQDEEMYVVWKDGTIRWLLASAAPVRDRDGAVVAGILAFTDITERKRAEDALRTSQAFLDSIIEHSPYSTWVSDERGTLIRCNQVLRDTLHVTDDDVVGKANIFRDEQVEEQGLMPLVRRVYERAETVRFTMRYDGALLQRGEEKRPTDLILDITMSPVVDASNRLRNVIIQHVDITDRIRASEQLRASEERFRRLALNSADIVTVTDAAGVITYATGATDRILGYAPEELLGKSGLPEVHPDDLDAARTALSELVRQPGLERRLEYRYRHKDGHWVWLEAVGSNLPEGAGASSVVLNIRDASERKAAEEERRALQNQLQQAMKMEAVGRLAGGVAHDFNNLLTAISGNIELAVMDLSPTDPLRQYLDQVSKAAASAASLTRQLLAFSRRQIIESRILNLNDLIADLVKMIGRVIGEDISLTLTLSPDLGAVRVDPGQFEQVLVNLAVNARDAMPSGGTLLIETASVNLDESYCATHPDVAPGPFVMLCVSDSGEGMSDDVKQHLFEPFFTTKPKGRGTGLGLATTFGIVKQAGGTIEVYSEIGRGTSFKIYLPSVREPATRFVKAKPSAGLPTGHETILLVEDDASVRELGRSFLTRLGYEVLVAANGGEAFMLVERHGGPIHLLMTDVVMPGMNGREVAERLRRIHPEMRVLFASGYTENVIVHHGMLDDDVDFLGKPFTMQALAEKIRAILERP